MSCWCVVAPGAKDHLSITPCLRVKCYLRGSNPEALSRLILLGRGLRKASACLEPKPQVDLIDRIRGPQKGECLSGA